MRDASGECALDCVMTYPPPPDQPPFGESQYGQPQYAAPQAPPYGQPAYPPADYVQPPTAPYGQQAAPYAQQTQPYGYPAAPRPRLSEPVVGWLMLGAGVLLVIGAAMPWATVLTLSVAGTVGGGKATMFFGLVIAVFGLLIGLKQGRLWVSITACVLAALVVLIALGNMGNITSIARKSDELFLGATVSIGSGLWLTLVAGLAALAASIVGIARRPLQKT
jgi:hypothetical protein